MENSPFLRRTIIPYPPTPKTENRKGTSGRPKQALYDTKLPHTYIHAPVPGIVTSVPGLPCGAPCLTYPIPHTPYSRTDGMGTEKLRVDGGNFSVLKIDREIDGWD